MVMLKEFSLLKEVPIEDDEWVCIYGDEGTNDMMDEETNKRKMDDDEEGIRRLAQLFRSSTNREKLEFTHQVIIKSKGHHSNYRQPLTLYRMATDWLRKGKMRRLTQFEMNAVNALGHLYERKMKERK
jgi:hypothetical protein